MVKLPPLNPNSRTQADLGKVVMLCVPKTGGIRVVTNPVPGHELSIRNLTNNLAILMEKDGDDMYFVDALKIENVGSLDAITREAIRQYRSETGITLNPLSTLPTRKSPTVPPDLHSVLWAYQR